MRWLAASAVVLVLASVSVTASAVPRKRVPVCDSIAGRTITETPTVRVFLARLGNLRICLRGRRGGGRRDVQPGHCLHACLLSQLTVAGRYYAYAYRVDGDKSDANEHLSVHRVDLRSNAQVDLPAGGPLAPPVSSRVDVVALVLSSRGDFAWIVRDPTVTPTEYEVHKFGAGSATLVDRAPGIDPASLALAGSTVYWTRDAMPKRFVLPG